MRGFPFGTFSSFNRLSFGGMTGPSAEREAPYATSPVAIGICSMQVPNPTHVAVGSRAAPVVQVAVGFALPLQAHVTLDKANPWQHEFWW